MMSSYCGTNCHFKTIDKDLDTWCSFFETKLIYTINLKGTIKTLMCDECYTKTKLTQFGFKPY